MNLSGSLRELADDQESGVEITEIEDGQETYIIEGDSEADLESLTSEFPSRKINSEASGYEVLLIEEERCEGALYRDEAIIDLRLMPGDEERRKLRELLAEEYNPDTGGTSV